MPASRWNADAFSEQVGYILRESWCERMENWFSLNPFTSELYQYPFLSFKVFWHYFCVFWDLEPTAHLVGVWTNAEGWDGRRVAVIINYNILSAKSVKDSNFASSFTYLASHFFRFCWVNMTPERSVKLSP